MWMIIFKRIKKVIYNITMRIYNNRRYTGIIKKYNLFNIYNDLKKAINDYNKGTDDEKVYNILTEYKRALISTRQEILLIAIKEYIRVKKLYNNKISDIDIDNITDKVIIKCYSSMNVKEDDINHIVYNSNKYFNASISISQKICDIDNSILQYNRIIFYENSLYNCIFHVWNINKKEKFDFNEYINAIIKDFINIIRIIYIKDNNNTEYTILNMFEKEYIKFKETIDMYNIDVNNINNLITEYNYYMNNDNSRYRLLINFSNERLMVDAK